MMPDGPPVALEAGEPVGRPHQRRPRAAGRPGQGDTVPGGDESRGLFHQPGLDEDSARLCVPITQPGAHAQHRSMTSLANFFPGLLIRIKAACAQAAVYSHPYEGGRAAIVSGMQGMCDAR